MYTFTLEANELSLGTCFCESPLGRIPIEIRLQIYTLILLIEDVQKPDGISDEDIKPPTKHLQSAWENDIRHFGKQRKEYIWPPTIQSPEMDRASCSEENALTASFPVPTPSRVSSRLSILLTCRQIYTETRLLYYTINTFHFPSYKSSLKLLRHYNPSLHTGIRSISVTRWIHDSDLHVRDALGLLRQWDGIQSLTLQFAIWDRKHLIQLRKIRGLKKAEFSVLLYPTRNGRMNDEDRELWVELQKIAKLVVVPRKAVS